MRLYFICFLLFGVSISLASANQCPSDVLAAARTVPTKINEKVLNLNPSDLVGDEYFLSTLESELKSSDTDEEKVYFFYCISEAIGWGFVGAMTLPPNTDYFHVMYEQYRTFQHYREVLSKQKLPFSGFKKLTLSYLDSNPILSGYSLLLYSLLTTDLADLNQAVYTFLNIETNSETPLPSMMFHFACLASSFVKSQSVTKQLYANLQQPIGEEDKEDMLIAIALGKSPGDSKGKMIEDFLLNGWGEHADLAVETAILILKASMDNTSFLDEMKELAPLVKEKNTAAVIRLTIERNGDFKYKLSSTPDMWAIKSWDGLNLTVYDDYVVVTNKNDLRLAMKN